MNILSNLSTNNGAIMRGGERGLEKQRFRPTKKIFLIDFNVY